MSLNWIAGGGLLFSGLASVLLCRLVMAAAMMDRAEEAHKIHRAPVPTSGGLGIAVAVFAGAAACIMASSSPIDGAMRMLAVASASALLLGLADDRHSLKASTKLIAMVAIALLFLSGGGAPMQLGITPGIVAELSLPMAGFLAMLWCVAVMNAVNFMDGANGLAMGMCALAAAGLAVCAFVSGAPAAGLTALCLAGALCGFLVWNGPGKLFAGDAGSLFVGLLIAGLSLAVVARRPDLALLPPAILSPLLIDVFGTLAYRFAKGEPLMRAHRDHMYQVAMRAGLAHWQIALVYCFAMVNVVGMCVVAALVGGWIPAAVFTGVVLSGLWLHVSTRIRAIRAGFA
jgi:UDP-N-acetylmuramyl pentapeptide phosphotransferase/UDP-N-acetylglucosamine-1-phosphate transferase